jgi:hypothetical protein
MIKNHRRFKYWFIIDLLLPNLNLHNETHLIIKFSVISRFPLVLSNGEKMRLLKEFLGEILPADSKCSNQC